MWKKLTLEEVNQRLRFHHGNKVKIDYSTYKWMGEKALFINKDFEKSKLKLVRITDKELLNSETISKITNTCT